MTAEPVALAPPSPAEIRAELEEMLLANILGPEAGEHEELVTDTRPSEYYVVGMLAPRRRRHDATEYDGLQDQLALEGIADEVGPTTQAAAATGGRSLFPSSLGMTFGVASQATEVLLEARWGRYERVTLDEEGEEKPPRAWRRSPAGGRCEPLVLKEGSFGPFRPDPEWPAVVVRGEVRRLEGHWVVSAFLVNDQEELASAKDEAWLFQASLSATAPDGPAVICRPLLNASPDSSEEDRALDMAFRDRFEVAIGHGTGVHAEISSSDPSRATKFATTAVPTAEVPRTEPPSVEDFPALGRVDLDMERLAKAKGEELPKGLRPLAAAYRQWVMDQRRRIGDPAARLNGFEATAEAALSRCERAATRIEAAIDLLDPTSPQYQPDAADAFRFANEAMWLQRDHSLAAGLRRSDPGLSINQALANASEPANHRWYPFQLAFLLLNLPSLADPTHPERGPGSEGLVDLLWFPTGGGKTEAYLGLTAFTLAIRRFQGIQGTYDGSDGVAVLMRYTLRVLTVQQFQRAAALLCACEHIRSERASSGDRRLGEIPFRLGLWVGAAVSPTHGEQSAQAIEDARVSPYRAAKSNPVQLTSCPWCGAPVERAKDAEYDPVRRRTLVYCGDKLGQCRFTRRHARGEGLPVLTVDDEIYRLVPSMVIATADKFAQLPWQGPSRALFGRVSRRCQRHGWRHPDLDELVGEHDHHMRHGEQPAAETVAGGPLRPPDLIIQDELHLISGPLGSLMGLYETAVDHLSTWEIGGKAVRPKVVASTATVRRAEAQAHAVFWRRLEIFPPPGLDARDSFFALQRAPDVASGRRYLGVCAPGRRIKAVEIRVYVALLGAAQALFERYGTAVDPWMTLVGYFSALRDLAGMSRLVDDDVSTRLAQAPARGLARRFLRQSSKEELTSRKTSTEIPAVLDRLARPFGPGQPAAGDNAGPGPSSKTHKKEDQSRRPIDVLLATNMISVGVDVPRLGLMVVGGQPKATAEYVQATSRVGRSGNGPGLVVTVLNWARPRDLSHYEAFEHFHSTLARHVEALSVTPFASRSLERGLTAVAVAMVRHQSDATNTNGAAQYLDPRAAAEEAIAVLSQRAESVTSAPELAQQVRSALMHRVDSWVFRQDREVGVLGYRGRRDGKTVALLQYPGDTRWGIWTCPTSLRDVEPGINLLLGLELRSEGGEPPEQVGPGWEFPPRKEKADKSSGNTTAVAGDGDLAGREQTVP